MKRLVFPLIFLSFFFASAIEAQTISVSPSNADQYQTFEVKISGNGTNFNLLPGLGIVFSMGASDSFSTISTPIASTSVITAYVSIPGNATPGMYDVRIINTQTDSTYYSADGIFTVNPGLQPSISILPDSGAAGTNFNVTIDGNNTFFNAAENNSSLSDIAIDLISSDTIYYSVHPTLITSDLQMKALFNLPDTLQTGLYIARVHSTGAEPPFDDSQYFHIKAAPIITLPNTKSGQAGRTVSVDVVVQGFPTLGSNIQALLTPSGNLTSPLQDSSINLTTDSTFTAVFQLPSSLTPGPYDIVILSFGNFSLTGKGVFTVEPFSGVDMPLASATSIEVSPNPADGNVDFSFTLPSAIHARLVLFDALGRIVNTLRDGITSGQQHIEWNSDNVPAGSYFSELTAGDSVYRGRVIVRH